MYHFPFPTFLVSLQDQIPLSSNNIFFRNEGKNLLCSFLYTSSDYPSCTPPHKFQMLMSLTSTVCTPLIHSVCRLPSPEQEHCVTHGKLFHDKHLIGKDDNNYDAWNMVRSSPPESTVAQKWL